MKINLTSKIKSPVMFVTTAAILLTSTSIFAANPKSIRSQLENQKYNRAVISLINGIDSENAGIKKSSIYLAGFYEITEASYFLMKQLRSEDDPDIRILIALSLYKIGDAKGFETIKSLAENDDDPKVKKVCREICNDFSKVVNTRFSQISN